MSNKKSLTLITAALIAPTLMIALTWNTGAPIKDAVAGLMLYALIGLLAACYLMRFALIFLGIFALFRMLQNWYYRQAGA